VLQQLGFAQRDLDLPIKALSGGQKSRAQIARLLLEQPELMLLDEPTNHLDLPMLDWLETTLNAMTETTLLVVSHDRYFLDSVVNEIVEMEAGTLQHYPGNYSDYVELRAERRLAQQRAFSQQQAYIAKQEEFIRRFQANQRARQARGRRTRLERLKRDNAVAGVRGAGRAMVLNLTVEKPSGHEVLKLENLSKHFGEKNLFEGLDLNIIRGKRLGIIGRNGSGKTTLLNALFGEVPTDAGTLKWGHGVKLKYYRQEHQDLHDDNNVLQELQSVRITATQQALRDLAALFLFSGDTAEKKLAVLSGGERSRVALAKLLLNPTNTILMDEPTNHLDMPTAEVLEEALDSYDGTLILVSHDRYFLDQVCDHLLELQGDGKWRLYNGSYTDYLNTRAAEQAAAATAKKQAESQAKKQAAKQAAKPAAPVRPAPRKAQPKLPHHLAKLDLPAIEKKIMAAEEQVAACATRFGDPSIAADPAAMAKLQAEYDAAQAGLTQLNAAWEAKAETA
jgi:ATP-binding cassette subfamily F protein 3